MCENPAYCRNLCMKHYRRFMRHGSMDRKIMTGLSTEERLRRYSEERDGCLVWTGPSDRAGYGRISQGGKKRFVHRVSYELEKGPIPKGLLIRHTCDNPPCINPDHLLPGTDADNSHDKVQRGRQFRARGEKSGTAKITDQDVVHIRRRYKDGATQRELAAEFSMSVANISRIILRQRWQHVD